MRPLPALRALGGALLAMAASTAAADTAIGTIQGNGDSSPLVGQSVTASGIVIGDFQGVPGSSTLHPEQLSGFFMQTPDADVDGDAATSEGIFVYCDSCPVAVAEGDAVTVTGTVAERFGLTSIEATGAGDISVASSGNALPAASDIDLPIADLASYEPLEAMLVRFPDTLTIAEYFQLGRFGEVVMFEGGRPFQFTHDNAPSVAGFTAHQENLALRRVILDDDANGNNQALFEDLNVFHPRPGLSTANFFRGGDTITNLTGVLDFAFGNWRIRPVLSAFTYAFAEGNPRPAAPEAVGGTLKVVSTNVLNYFATIDTTASRDVGDCSPSGTLDCRGADSLAELERQEDKITAALCAMDADIVGLVEIENDVIGTVARLIGAIEEDCGIEYNDIETGFIGSDAIKVGMLYKSTVTPVGAPFIIDDSVDPAYVDGRNRPTLVQTFEEVASGERVIIANHHLKSKGSDCDDLGDPDANDGQGNCNLTRTGAANVIIDFINNQVIPDAGTNRVLVIGDLNAYRREDPIQAFINAGYTDLIEAFNPTEAYSFVFDGQRGYLDNTLGLNVDGLVTGVTAWHVNADEINLFDYNDDVLDAGEASFEEEPDNLPLYDADPYRYSDHDPVLIGLDLSGSAAETVALPLPLLALVILAGLIGWRGTSRR